VDDPATIAISASTFASVIAGWAALRVTVRRHAEEIRELRRELDRRAEQIASLQRWRERARGAEIARTAARQATRDDTQPISITSPGSVTSGYRPDDD
jgi:hypothetical protein